MAGKDVQIAADAGAFTAYVAAPAVPAKAAIVVIQEIFGVNANMRAVCDVWAARGYLALCPDLFWRIEPGVQLTDQSPEEWQRAFALYSAFDVDAGVRDIAATIAHARLAMGAAKVGAIGFCLGGLLAFLTACRTDVNASVSYYGVGIQDKMAEAARLASPVLLHVAGKDQYVPPPAQAAIKDGLAGFALARVEIYPEQDHAFARAGGAHFDAAAAHLANARTEAFFTEHLA